MPDRRPHPGGSASGAFPGLLDRRRLGFGEKAIAAAVHVPEGDYRPWDEIEAWAREIAAAALAADVEAGITPA